MRIDVPWSTGTTPVEIEERRVAGVLGADVERAADPAAVLRAAVDARRAREFAGVLGRGAIAPAGGGQRRHTAHSVGGGAGRTTAGAGGVAAARRATSSRSWWPQARIGWPRPQEVDHIFGADLAKAHAERIFSHDAKDKDSLVHLGRTSQGHGGLGQPPAGRGPQRGAHQLGGAALLRRLHGRAQVAVPRTGRVRDGVGQSQPVYGEGLRATWCSRATRSTRIWRSRCALGIAGKQIYSIQLVLDKDHRIGFASAGLAGEDFRGGCGRGRQAVRARARAALRGGGSGRAAPHGLQLLPDQQGHPERRPGGQGRGRAHSRVGVPVRPGREPDAL